MGLSTNVGVVTSVQDVPGAIAFYEKLGFKKIDDAILTDGSLNLHLVSEGDFSPTLHYFGTDFEKLKESGLNVQFTDTHAHLNSPDGVKLVFTTEAAPVPMPDGDIMTRTPISRCGKFGEYAIPVDDFDASLAFWEKLGFKQLHKSNEPYTWGIFSDDLIVIGLHEVNKGGHSELVYDAVHITYFKGDMAERITALKADGIAIEDIPPQVDGKIVNASFTGPGGQKFFLFEGEI